MTTIPPKVYLKNTSVRKKSPKQKLIGFVLFLLFLATLLYFFASDKNLSESGKVEKYRTELNNLKNKIKNGEELNEGERNRFCELLWLVERIGINNCQCLARDELLFFVKNLKDFVFPDKVQKFNLNLNDREFELFKQKTLLPKFYNNADNKYRKQMQKLSVNPDVGIWTHKRFVVFRPSQSNKFLGTEHLKEKFILYTLQPIDEIP